MIARILLAVDDSADSFAAVRVAVELAGGLGARLRIVHVSAPGSTAARAPGEDGAILTRMAAIAAAAGVTAESDLRAGVTGHEVLEAAREWPADLIVLGRAAHHVSGAPYVGAETRHVLEFAEQPVLVVPRGRKL